MEEYLIKDYGVIEDLDYLTKEEDIEDYFTDEGYNMFECGQGYYNDEITVICKIEDKFYNVTVKAGIGSERQDRGDRLYFVDYIDSVSYEEIEKPKPKNRDSISIKINVTKAELNKLEDFMEESQIEYVVCK